MDPASSLTAVIEFSIGLAGFSGLIFAIRGGEKLGVFNTNRVMALILYAFAAGFAAFIAMILASYQEQETAWRIASGVLGLMLIGLFAFNLRWVLKLRIEGIRIPDSPGYRLIVWGYFTTFPLMILIELINVTPLFDQLAFTVLLFGMVFVLFWGAMQFVQLIIRAWE